MRQLASLARAPPRLGKVGALERVAVGAARAAVAPAVLDKVAADGRVAGHGDVGVGAVDAETAVGEVGAVWGAVRGGDVGQGAGGGGVRAQVAEGEGTDGNFGRVVNVGTRQPVGARACNEPSDQQSRERARRTVGVIPIVGSW